jgi:hypothetical protein
VHGWIAGDQHCNKLLVLVRAVIKYGVVLRDVTHYNLVKGPLFSG